MGSFGESSGRRISCVFFRLMASSAPKWVRSTAPKQIRKWVSLSEIRTFDSSFTQGITQRQDVVRNQRLQAIGKRGNILKKCGERGKSVNRPDARGGEFDQVPVGVAEIEARAAEFPMDAALDGHALFAKPLLPRHQFAVIDGEGKMQRSAAIVGRYDSTGSLDRLGGAVLQK